MNFILFDTPIKKVYGINNVFELGISLIKKCVCRNTTNKDQCLVGYFKVKITIFRGAMDIVKALISAKLLP